jgi:probable phosphoglycerate mutase
MEVFLIRHGEHHPPEPGLTETGQFQARCLGERLQSSGIDHIYTSPLERTLQTSAILRDYLPVGLDIWPELREIEMGDCENPGWDFVRANNPTFIAAFDAHTWDIPYPNGESGQDVWARAWPRLLEIANSGWSRAAVVTHGGVIRVLVCGILGLPQQHRFKLGSPPVNCGLTVLKTEPETGQFKLHVFNDYAHIHA